MSEPVCVSVVIPCRNRAHFLRPTIESVLEQDYPTIECIVVDGGSTDETVEVLRSYGDRIRWISEPDRGHSEAINKGWRMSHGEILAWLNADDLWIVPSAARQAVAYFAQHPDVDLVYGQCETVDGDGNVIGMSYVHDWDLAHALEHCDHCIPQPAAFMRRRIVDRVGGLDEEILAGKDHDLWLRIAREGTLRYLPVILARERACEGTWDRRGDMTAEGKVRLTRKFFSRPDLPENLRRLQRRAMSNAYLKGAQYALKYGRHWDVVYRYTLQSFLEDPSNAVAQLGWFTTTLRVQASELPPWAYLPLRWLKRKSESLLQSTGVMHA